MDAFSKALIFHKLTINFSINHLCRGTLYKYMYIRDQTNTVSAMYQPRDRYSEIL